MSSLYEMTPKEIVGELDKYIIGQERAKKSVTVTLKNRYKKNIRLFFTYHFRLAYPQLFGCFSRTSFVYECPLNYLFLIL